MQGVKGLRDDGHLMRGPTAKIHSLKQANQEQKKRNAAILSGYETYKILITSQNQEIQQLRVQPIRTFVSLEAIDPKQYFEIEVALSEVKKGYQFYADVASQDHSLIGKIKQPKNVVQSFRIQRNLLYEETLCQHVQRLHTACESVVNSINKKKQWDTLALSQSVYDLPLAIHSLDSIASIYDSYTKLVQADQDWRTR